MPKLRNNLRLHLFPMRQRVLEGFGSFRRQFDPAHALIPFVLDRDEALPSEWLEVARQRRAIQDEGFGEMGQR